MLLLDAEADALLLAGLAALVIRRNMGAFGWGVAPTDTGIALPAVLMAGAVALLLAGWLRPALAAGYHRLAPPIPPQAWRWLLLFAWLVLALRFGGKIYPESMRGDIGFHSNRYDLLVGGWVLQLSLNRGVSFPYPTAFYLLLAPFSLLGLPQRILLRLGGALLDALSPLLDLCDHRAYHWPRWAAKHNAGQARRAARRSRALRLQRGRLYDHLVELQHPYLHTVRAAAADRGAGAALQRSTTDHRPPTTDELLVHRFLVLVLGSRFPVLGSRFSALLVVLQSLIYLGHFGFWMNMSLLGAIGLAVLLLAAWRGRVLWRAFRLAFCCVCRRRGSRRRCCSTAALPTSF